MWVYYARKDAINGNPIEVVVMCSGNGHGGTGWCWVAGTDRKLGGFRYNMQVEMSGNGSRRIEHDNLPITP
jgi:hypothetical protein